MAESFPADLYIRTTWEEEFLRPIIRSRKELGYRKSRPQWTKTLRSFKMIVTTRDETERDTLIAFLEAVALGGDVFELDHPITEVTHTVGIMSDSVKMKYIGGGAHLVRLTVAEVE